MGSLREIAKSFDGSGDELEAQKEVIQTLSALAQSRLDGFDTRINNSYLTAGTEGNPTFPIAKLMSSWSRTHAYTESSASVLTDKLRDATKSFLAGGGEGIASGVFSIIDGALTALFVDSVASEGKDELYQVYCANDMVTRLDMCAWYRDVTATAITKKMQKASCFIIRQAAIDCKRVDWYSFMSVVKASYGALNLTPDEFEAAIKRAEDAFKKGGGVVPPGSAFSAVEAFPNLQEQYRALMRGRPDAWAPRSEGMVKDEHVD